MNENSLILIEVPIRRDDDGELVVRTTDLAALFSKRHADVLRRIESEMAMNADLRSLEFFREVKYLDTKMREQRAYDCTELGWWVAVLGFQGAMASKLKVWLLRQFRAMREQINAANRFVAKEHARGNLIPILPKTNIGSGREE
jgi:Rha family phage regulatory protein